MNKLSKIGILIAILLCMIGISLVIIKKISPPKRTEAIVLCSVVTLIVMTALSTMIKTSRSKSVSPKPPGSPGEPVKPVKPAEPEEPDKPTKWHCSNGKCKIDKNGNYKSEEACKAECTEEDTKYWPTSQGYYFGSAMDNHTEKYRFSQRNTFAVRRGNKFRIYRDPKTKFPDMLDLDL